MDGVYVGEAYVDPSTWLDYSFPYVSSGGNEELTITFDNDKYTPPYDRNLFIDDVSIVCP